MRKHTIGTGLMLVLALGLALLAAAPASAVPVSATLTSIVGDVQVHAPGGTWKKATEGMTVKNGTEIKTGAKSTVVIKWSTKNVIKLTPYTNFTVKSMDVDPRSKTVNTNVEISSGKVKGRAEKLRNPNSSYTISTPTAVAGVRGTTFDMANTADNSTELYTYDGLMEATAQGQTVQVPAGTFVTIDPGQPPTQPQTIKDDDKHTCQSNEDCWSGVCVNGACMNEENSVGNACYPEEAECAADEQCCSGDCLDTGKCAAVDTATMASACVDEGGSCAADKECCNTKGLVCDNGQCTPKSQTCTAAGETCQNDNQCCSSACEDGVCLDDDATAGKDTNANCDAIQEEQGCSSAGCFWSADDNKCCTEEGCPEAAPEGMYVTISEPETGAEFPLSKGEIALSGSTLPNAECNVNGTPFTASPSGGFSGTIGDLADGALPITINCFDPVSQTAANAAVEIDIIGPPMLIVTSPEEGFLSCPTVNISGLTDPGASVYLNGENIFNSDKAKVTSDGSFTYDGFQMADCGAPLIFEAQDSYSQITQVVINAGSGGNLAAMGVNISAVKLMVQASGQWMYGQTMVNAVVTVQASTPIPPGVVADIVNPNTGEFVQSALLYPQYGDTSTDGSYYANAEVMIMAGPGPLFLQALMGGQASGIESLDLQPPACITGAARAVGGGDMTPGDGLDNDCDGLIDEEMPDGIDNDGDGLADEDVACDFSDGTADCDRDGVANSSDCNPFDPYISSGCAMDFAFNGIIPDDRFDNDGDGLVDEEAMDGMDNDGDGLIDEDTSMGCPVEDPYADCDYDGLINRDDCNPFDPGVAFDKADAACVTSCDPFAEPFGDCDKDGLENSIETNMGLDPFNRDTDGDGYSDYAEMSEGYDPRNPADNPGAYYEDSDNDGYPDVVELSYGSDPNNSASTPVTTGAISSVDSDSDGYPDDIEYAYGSDPYNAMSVPGNETVGVAGMCSGGQEYDPATGQCFCPRGTTWDPAMFYCIIPEFAQCAAGEFFDEFMGGCVATCTGGQTADTINGVCFCSTGVRDWSSLQCASSCPTLSDGTAMVANEYGDCMCPPDKPLWSTYRNTCVSSCIEGLIVNEFNECTCPTGTFLDYSTGKCLETTSASICPPGTMGEYCDYSVFGDCDKDGLDNFSDANPCFNETGTAMCPADSDAPNCDLMLAGDCDNDSADNSWDPCPCGFGNAYENYCPQIDNCPTGTFLDPRAQTCVQTCPADMMPNTSSGECVCTTGYFDYMSYQCTTSCPPGTEPVVLGDGSNICGCPSTTPLWDDFVGACATTCSAGQQPSPDYTSCECPMGTYPDYATMMCMEQNYDYCGTTPPFEQGCPCATSSDCQSGVCDIYYGQCMPPAGCDNNSYCDPSFENTASCSDCYCGDGLCDEAEASSASCQTDCAGMCDASVMEGDCDGDGIINMNDMCPYLWVDAALRPDGCPDMSACPNYGSDMASCSADPGCFWNYDYNECWTQGAGGCEVNSTEATCMTMSGCVWDSMNMMCVPDFIGGCETNTTETMCMTAPGCAWDFNGNFCYYAGSGDPCGAYTDSPTCAGDPACRWNSYTAMCNGSSVACEGYMDQMTCGGDPLCSWSSMNSMCVTGSVSDCYSYADQVACSNDPACMWDSMSMSCVYAGGMCNTYSTEGTCISDPSCTWNSMTMLCEEAGMTGCASLVDSTTCMGDPTCYWNSGSNACYSNAESCFNYPDDVSCGGAPTCTWNGSLMQCEDTVSTCAQIGDQVTCENTNCVWDAGMMTCSDYAGGCNMNSICESGENMMTCSVDCPGCSMIMDSVDCSADPGCFWNGSSCMTNSVEMCADSMDNDGDSLIDCADTGDCGMDPACMPETACADTVDNDGDSFTDCADSDCSMDPACTETNCTDTVDNDGDSFTDCADSDCASDPACMETACADTVDNDGDSFTDCADSDCVSDPACLPETACNDTVDNDGDSFTDCADSDCTSDPACMEMGNCADTIDNDGDSFTDCADTTDCSSDPACIPETTCYDGIDNEGDSFTDCTDSDCTTDPFCMTCSTTTDCGGYGFSCTATVCSYCGSTPPFADGCGGASPTDCTSNYLVGGTECAACSTAADCALTAAGLECNAGVCQPGACGVAPSIADGCSCTSGTDCLSTICTGNVCTP